MEKDSEIKFTEKKVDDSWKEAIDQEKERVAQARGSSREPISFIEFFSSLGMQALVHLGDMENPVTKKKEKNLEAAHETIDLLVLLKDKTKGNLTQEENLLLTNLIADLQLRYVERIHNKST